MDRIIEVKVYGNHLTKDSNNAGTRGEGNATKLRITFDKSWEALSKTVVFWDAYGQNPVSVTVGLNLLEGTSTNVYLVPIPQEAMARAGELTFSIRGEGTDSRQVSITGKLEVEDSPEVLESLPPTPSQWDQMQLQYDEFSEDMQTVRKAIYTDFPKAMNDIEVIKGETQLAEANAKGYAKSAEEMSWEANGSAVDSAESAKIAAGHAGNAEQWADIAMKSLGWSPYIGEDGYWYVYDSLTRTYSCTGIKGQAGSTVYYGDNPPEDADVWINPNGEPTGLNIEDGTGINSIQQRPETESWSATNTRITDFLIGKNNTTEDGAEVVTDSKGKILVGAYGKNSAMFGAKSQTVGGKTFAAGSKSLAFENNAFAVGNGTFAGGKHSGALNNETCALENSALAINNGTTARGKSSFSSGDFTEAIGEASDAGGKQTVSEGDFSFSRGMFGKAKGRASAVIGDNCIASDNNAMATGSNTVAGNVNTFSSGHMTFAFGEQAHSENCHTFAGVRGFQILSKTTWVTELTDDSETLTIYLDSCEGLEVGDVITVVTSRVFLDMAPIVAIKSEENKIVVSAPLDMPVLSNCSIDIMFVRKKPWLGNKVVGHHTHSEGYGTIASTDAQHVQGKYNYVDIEGKYAHIVGNGKSEHTRSNAHTVDWNGNGWFAGGLEAQYVVLTSPNGTRYKLVVNNDGQLSTERFGE